MITALVAVAGSIMAFGLVMLFAWALARMAAE